MNKLSGFLFGGVLAVAIAGHVQQDAQISRLETQLVETSQRLDQTEKSVRDASQQLYELAQQAQARRSQDAAANRRSGQGVLTPRELAQYHSQQPAPPSLERALRDLDPAVAAQMLKILGALL